MLQPATAAVVFSSLTFTSIRPRQGLCLDLDGELGPLKLGDTGSEVFVSGIAPGRATAPRSASNTTRGRWLMFNAWKCLELA